MCSLHLESNLLTGAVDLTALPTSILDLSVANNKFSGAVVLQHLPSSLGTQGQKLESLWGLSGSVKKSFLPKFTNVKHTSIHITE